MTISERMFKIMNDKGVRPTDVANKLQVNKSVVSSWKTRNSNPPAEFIVQICELLGVSERYLLGGIDEELQPCDDLGKNTFLHFTEISQKIDYINKVLHLKDDTVFTRFKEAREAADITVEEAAQSAFLKEEDILFIENDDVAMKDISSALRRLQEIDLQQYACLAYKYNVDLYWLLCGKVRPPAAVVQDGKLVFPPYPFMLREGAESNQQSDQAEINIDLAEDEVEMLRVYRYLSTEGKGWAYDYIVDHLKKHENLSSSRQRREQQSRGGIA